MGSAIGEFRCCPHMLCKQICDPAAWTWMSTHSYLFLFVRPKSGCYGTGTIAKHAGTWLQGCKYLVSLLGIIPKSFFVIMDLDSWSLWSQLMRSRPPGVQWVSLSPWCRCTLEWTAVVWDTLFAASFCEVLANELYWMLSNCTHERLFQLCAMGFFFGDAWCFWLELSWTISLSQTHPVLDSCPWDRAQARPNTLQVRFSGFSSGWWEGKIVLRLCGTCWTLARSHFLVRESSSWCTSWTWLMVMVQVWLDKMSSKSSASIMAMASRQKKCKDDGDVGPWVKHSNWGVLARWLWMMTVSLLINVHWSPGGALLWRIFAIFTVLALLVFGWRTYKMAKDAFDKFEQLYTDVAVLEAAVGSCRIKTKP